MANSTATPAPSALTIAADAVANDLNADVLFYSGGISQADWVIFSKLCAGRRKRDNVLLVLVTPGGDPDAAYKMGRALQDKYKVFGAFIPGWCKSAGTLLTIAASTLYIGDMGELGPLDIQLAKQDELDEMASGLLLDATMRTLEVTAFRMFLSFVSSIRRETRISTRTASELSATMVSGLVGQIYSHIDPMKIGESVRALNITKSYGTRLNSKSKTLIKTSYIDFLLSGYPDHGFVIDRDEAKIIFKDVREPTPSLILLADALGDKALYPKDSGESREVAEIRYLSTEVVATAGAGTTAAAASGIGVRTNGRAGGKGTRGKGSGRRSTSPTGTGTGESIDRADGHENQAGGTKG